MPPSQPSTHLTNLDQPRLTSLINSMADGVLAVDGQAKIVLYNAAALNILDINTNIEGQQLGSVLHIFTQDNRPIEVETLITATKVPTATRDYLLHYAEGSTANLYLSIAPVHEGYGEDTQGGFVLVLRDITHEKSVEEERDEFISVASHELRTPITIAEGNLSNALYIADKTGNLTQIKQALKDAHSQVVFLSDMFNDLATLSRAERGRLTIEIKSINVHHLVEQLATTYQQQATAKGLTLKTDLDPHLEILNSSELYLHEILQNFVTNALKYTLGGGIVIGAKQKPGGAELWISDTGIGISHGDQAKVFGKFFRSEDYRIRATSGTGLGLYITLKLANLLKAQIKLESEFNIGSTFTIFVPNLPQP